jgi:hypothetical protein
MEAFMASLFGMQINQVMLIAGIGLFVFVMINRLRRGFGKTGGGVYTSRTWQSERRPGHPARSPREEIVSARLRSAAALPEHESWEVEFHRLSREVKGEIETRMRALEQLIQLAEDARSRLDDSIGRAESLGLSGQRKASRDSRDSRSNDNGGDGDNSEFSSVGRRAERARNAKPNRETVRSLPITAGDDPGEDPRFERVYALADAGFSATKIAGQIGSQIGEVELILSLRRPNHPGMLADSDMDASRPRAA